METSVLPRVLGAGCLLLGCCFAQTHMPSSVIGRVPGTEARERILDAAFGWLPVSAKDADVEITVKFYPSFHPESELDITARRGKPVSVRYSRATVAYQKAVALAVAQGDISETAVARIMHVEERSFVELPTYSQDVISNFWKAVVESAAPLRQRALAGWLQLDGTQYRVFIRSEMDSVSFTLNDDEVGTPDTIDKLPITRWTNALRSAFESRFGEKGGN